MKRCLKDVYFRPPSKSRLPALQRCRQAGGLRMLRASFERMGHALLRAASQSNGTAVVAKHSQDNSVAKCRFLDKLRPPLAVCQHVLLIIHRAGDGVLLEQAQALTMQLPSSKFRLLSLLRTSTGSHIHGRVGTCRKLGACRGDLPCQVKLARATLLVY